MYVEFTYNGDTFMGEVVKCDEERATINAMLRAGPTNWKWPAVKDIHDYPVEDVIRVIKAPVPDGPRAFKF